MNTVLNLLSAAAVVATGVFTSAAPAPHAAQTPIHLAWASEQQRQLEAAVHSDGPRAQWLTISEANPGRPADDAGYARPVQRWVF